MKEYYEYKKFQYTVKSNKLIRLSSSYMERSPYLRFFFVYPHYDRPERLGKDK
jgi:hypothetical protein